MSEVNPYEGLNLPDLLERLHELALPEPVSWLPQTDGWWVGLAWLAGVALLAARKWVAHRRANRYRREALANLDALSAAGAEPARVAELVKRTALSAYPRAKVAGLYGEEWADFLIRTSGDDPKIKASAAKLAVAAYRPDIQLDEVLPCAERWIRCHA